MERGGQLESVRVADSLRNDILFGRRPPGSRLVERDIAAELKVSRLPVREAIRALAAEGVVVARPRTWAVVRVFTPKDIRDFAEFREAIETLGFVLAAQRHDEKGAALMRDIVEREATAAAAGDAEAARAASAEFHVTAVSLSGNHVLIELGRSYLTRLRWLFGQHDGLSGMVADHRVMLEAFLARDVERLRVLVPRHLEEGRASAERRLCGGTT